MFPGNSGRHESSMMGYVFKQLLNILFGVGFIEHFRGCIGNRCENPALSFEFGIDRTSLLGFLF